MSQSHIRIRGARTHNLKNVSLDIPRDKFVVITGLSGSGKSSLAFDTLYAEGQRRYVESLSAYARQFLSQMEKPEVDSIEGLSPAIAIEQKSTSHNPRSTVGTITEIYDYLRLLYARVGTPYCPEHDLPMVAQTISEMVDAVKALPESTALMLLAPVVRVSVRVNIASYLNSYRDKALFVPVLMVKSLILIARLNWTKRKNIPLKWWWTALRYGMTLAIVLQNPLKLLYV